MSSGARTSKNDDDRVIRQPRKEGEKKMSVARRWMGFHKEKKTRCFVATSYNKKKIAYR
jgi:hypothetical protein